MAAWRRSSPRVIESGLAPQPHAWPIAPLPFRLYLVDIL
jgi:hypothetical protein